MTRVAEALLADALRLSPEVRAELAAELLASLDGPSDPDAEAAWAAEIERRVDAIEAGTVALEPWEESSAASRETFSDGEANSDHPSGFGRIRRRRSLVRAEAHRARR